MIRRLSELDLPRRLQGVAPPWIVELGAAGIAVGAAVVVRAMIEGAAPGVVPFALLFPAILATSLLAGWRAGVAALLLGGAFTWWLVMQPRPAPAPSAVVDLVNLVLYAAASGMIVMVAEAFRRSAFTLAEESERRSAEREGLLQALGESEARLELATAAGGVGVWDWRLDTNEIIYSAEARAIMGLPPEGPVTLEMVRALTHPDDAPRTRALSARAQDPEIRDEASYEYRIITPAGETRWMQANGRAMFETRGGDTVATRFVGTVQDITSRKRDEEARAESESRLRLAVEAGRMAVWQIDVATGGLANSPELNRILGLPDDADPTLEEVNARYAPGELERVQRLAQAAIASGQRFFDAEFRYRWPNGQLRWLLLRAEILMGASGQPRSAIGVILDVTERKESEERLKLLAREVDHRANNLMTVIQGTVSLSNAADVETLKAVIVGRVNALARAHQLLSEARWEGADLRRLVEEELLAFSMGEAARVSIEGPDTALAPAAAQSIAMALHELATNAAKYGALSAPEGRVHVAWTRPEDGRLLIRWVESGGPRVSKPSRRGLGTTMLDRALAGPMGGQTRLDWRPEGLVCELELPTVDEPETAWAPT